MGMRQLGAVDMDMALLHAGRQGREDLARIEQAPRVKGAFHAMLLFQIGRAELLGHQVALFHPDAMLEQFTLTQRRRMSAPKASALSNSPSFMVSKQIRGCRLPSPA